MYSHSGDKDGVTGEYDPELRPYQYFSQYNMLLGGVSIRQLRVI